MMQVFNFINARKLHEELNVLEGITKNKVFIIVVVVIIILQIIIVTFTGSAFGVYSNYGLTIQQWLITVLYFLFRSASAPSLLLSTYF